MSIDCETHDPHLKELGIGVRRGGYVCGFSFAIEDGPAFYIPVRHAGGNVDSEKAFEYLRDQARAFKGDIVGAHLPYDLDYLAEEKIVFTPRFFRDVQVAQPLINEHQRSYSLQSISEEYGFPGKDETLLKEAALCYGVSPKGGMAKLPAKYVGPYAEQDARLPLQILRKQERIIEDQDLWQIYDLESRVTPILVKMRRRGVRVDLEKLRHIEEWSLKEEAEALAFIKNKTGVELHIGDVWKAKRVYRALHEIGLVVPTTPRTGQPSITAEFLERTDHPVTDAVRRARKMNKLRTTFAASIRRYLIGDRIHTTFNQLRRQKGDSVVGTISGRLSSTDPNEQQQPMRDEEIGPLWRSIYVPNEGGLWLCADYSQQEPRTTVHFANECQLPGAAEAAQAYRDDPNMDYHQFMADVSGLKRKIAKNMFLGLVYNMGGAKMCKMYLNLPTKVVARHGRTFEVAGPEGQKILDQFHARVPFVKALSKMCEKAAQKKGYIRTLLNRHCRFAKLPDGSYDWTHKALNRLIQGSSADQTKAAMVALEEDGWELQLQVHDEVDLTIEDGSDAERIQHVMENCVQMSVPSKVDIEMGPSWGEIE